VPHRDRSVGGAARVRRDKRRQRLRRMRSRLRCQLRNGGIEKGQPLVEPPAARLSGVAA
jgi:hypothetical protein